MNSNKRVALFFVIALLSIGLAMQSACAALDLEAEADAIFTAVNSGQPVPALNTPEEFRTEDNAYAVQKILFDKILAANKGDAVAGIKGALTTPAQMKRFESDVPALAPLLKSGLTETNGLDSVEFKPYKGMMIEVELTFKTAVPITEPVKDEAALKTLFASVHPSIEIPQLYFADMSKVKFFEVVEAGIASKKFLVGPAFRPDDVDVDNVNVKLLCDGNVVNEGKASDALGGQWKALLWIVNNTLAHGYTLDAGQYIMTGALGNMIPAKPGVYNADYGFATLNFKVTE
ncbi:2-keto-4-pentenoate hydratase [Synergistales bacterium]|nr:2-keto-4-pentenoate hydratase [Synergistales bacterium]